MIASPAKKYNPKTKQNANTVAEFWANSFFDNQLIFLISLLIPFRVNQSRNFTAKPFVQVLNKLVINIYQFPAVALVQYNID